MSFLMSWVTEGHKVESEIGHCIDPGVILNELGHRGSRDRNEIGHRIDPGVILNELGHGGSRDRKQTSRRRGNNRFGLQTRDRWLVGERVFASESTFYSIALVARVYFVKSHCPVSLIEQENVFDIIIPEIKYLVSDPLFSQADIGISTKENAKTKRV